MRPVHLNVNIKGIAKTGQVFINNEELTPSRSQKVINHSPDGFAWGYGGSGPSQLALAILLKFYDKNVALRNYQDFKWRVVSKLDVDKDFDIDIDLAEYIDFV